MVDGCRGCKTSYKDRQGKYQCMLQVVSAIPEPHQCPCRTCIVKSMCLRDCRKFEKFLSVNTNCYKGRKVKNIAYHQDVFLDLASSNIKKEVNNA